MEIPRVEILADEPPDHVRTVTGPIARALPLLVGAFSAWIAISSRGLGIGSLSSPGAGFWPFYVSLITLVICLRFIVPGIPLELVSRGGVLRSVTLVGLFLLSWVLFEVLGFFVAATVLTFGMCTLIAQMGWLKSILTSVATSALTYVVFATFLGVRLPTLTPWI